MSRILIVDDEPDTRLMLGHYLQDRGYDVAFASNGWEALLMLDQWACDLILLDIMMPGLDGAKFLSILRSYASHGALPVVVVTALTHDEAASRIGTNQTQGVVEKKGTQFFKDLLDRVDHILKAPRGGGLMDGVMN